MTAANCLGEPKAIKNSTEHHYVKSSLSSSLTTNANAFGTCSNSPPEQLNGHNLQMINAVLCFSLGYVFTVI